MGPKTKAYGGASAVAKEEWDALSAKLCGRVLCEKDAAYEEARLQWNLDRLKRPSYVIRCESVSDVEMAVKFCREHSLDVTVASGRHSPFCFMDETVAIDLEGLHGIHVDTEKRIAHVQGGARLKQLDRECALYGLHVVAGINPSTGVAGLTLGGGCGYLSPMWGLTIDSFISAQLVTAEGDIVECSDEQHPDLMWALRGSGWNYGIVTRFDFFLRPVTTVFTGMAQWPLTHKTSSILAEVVRLGYDEYPELSLSLSFANPEGQPVAIIQPCGLDPDKGAKDWESVKARVGLPPPLMEDVGPRPYVELQGMMETLQPPSHCYEKGWLMKDFTPAVADKVIDALTERPFPGCTLGLAPFGKVANTVPDEATAFFNRSSRFWLLVLAFFEEGADNRQRAIDWTKQVRSAFAEYSTGSYVSIVGGMEDDPIESVYGGNLQRLKDLKRAWDPTNFFHNNRNVMP
ncbi:unnamed protein product [Vitrella brassicaformis CCMP3155]|uniref:FAD-binding PCMH-type domain-containing protein n=2 Tax=Vitrella brassicaformis TaxID=1169539 RepID=A0A0G4GL62_VITBC|nr:unnamed protein product [Vitrella brassicaformis CCMP3155]|eukprot:CEM30763.1 unnamed protein product [Vitrella brassicaformis CCMP3155]